ncbi:MAG TPA: FecR domain-containing protein [Chitinophagaceae bacterium]|jgi:ferric-dicitrate binding protein FerR (iron transport regulator)|nr:FecR domain-containing protein [Chitinophagaceae bacterium]
MFSSGKTNLEILQQANRTAYLIVGFIRQTLTLEEKEELDDWITASDENMRLFEELTDEKNITSTLKTYESVSTDEGLRKVKLRIRSTHKKFWQYAIAASFILVAGLSVLFIVNHNRNKKGRLVVTHDILPGKGQATLTLENGSVIELGGKDTTILSAINVSSSMNQISYIGLEQSPAQYHTLEVPSKGHYSLVLNDGTKVWLNAASSIRFPQTFSSAQRMVYVTGETYFEVAKDANRPFRVVANEMIVEAVGTAFNVNAYYDEPVKTTTLVEGKVKVFVAGDSILLIPGEKSLAADGSITKKNADISIETAWKDNKFKFRNTELSVIMRQLARWYGVEVEFTIPVDVHLNLPIDRGVPISRVLEILQATGEAKFEVKGNKVIVSK